jgi:hypothetical protein
MMLLVPSESARRFRYKFLGILVIGSLIVVFGAWNIPLPTTPENDVEPPPGPKTEDFFGAASPLITDNLLLIEFIQLMSVILGTFILIFGTFLWFPQLKLDTFPDTSVKMKWRMGRFRIPSRRQIFHFDSITIQIRRKSTSLSGIALRELLFEVHLEKGHPRWQDLADYATFERIRRGSNWIVLEKTIRPQHIPVQLIQARTLLSLPRIDSRT